MKVIGDILTLPEDIARYENYNNKMKALANGMVPHYINDLPFIGAIKTLLRKQYNDALEAATVLINSQEEAGPVGLRLKQ